ncbi:unnamed protein product [Amoebophrya sp. A25]|nr:unnamed protein product [Amoebophrya sp. A25]|eukprot:GSA25T00024465001.1
MNALTDLDDVSPMKAPMQPPALPPALASKAQPGAQERNKDHASPRIETSASAGSRSWSKPGADAPCKATELTSTTSSGSTGSSSSSSCPSTTGTCSTGEEDLLQVHADEILSAKTQSSSSSGTKDEVKQLSQEPQGEAPSTTRRTVDESPTQPLVPPPPPPPSDLLPSMVAAVDAVKNQDATSAGGPEVEPGGTNPSGASAPSTPVVPVIKNNMKKSSKITVSSMGSKNASFVGGAPPSRSSSKDEHISVTSCISTTSRALGAVQQAGAVQVQPSVQQPLLAGAGLPVQQPLLQVETSPCLHPGDEDGSVVKMFAGLLELLEQKDQEILNLKSEITRLNLAQWSLADEKDALQYAFDALVEANDAALEENSSTVSKNLLLEGTPDLGVVNLTGTSIRRGASASCPRPRKSNATANHVLTGGEHQHITGGGQQFHDQQEVYDQHTTMNNVENQQTACQHQVEQLVLLSPECVVPPPPPPDGQEDELVLEGQEESILMPSQVLSQNQELVTAGDQCTTSYYQHYISSGEEEGVGHGTGDSQQLHSMGMEFYSATTGGGEHYLIEEQLQQIAVGYNSYNHPIGDHQHQAYLIGDMQTTGNIGDQHQAYLIGRDHQSSYHHDLNNMQSTSAGSSSASEANGPHGGIIEQHDYNFINSLLLEQGYHGGGAFVVDPSPSSASSYHANGNTSTMLNTLGGTTGIISSMEDVAQHLFDGSSSTSAVGLGAEVDGDSSIYSTNGGTGITSSASMNLVRGLVSKGAGAGGDALASLRGSGSSEHQLHQSGANTSSSSTTVVSSASLSYTGATTTSSKGGGGAPRATNTKKGGGNGHGTGGNTNNSSSTTGGAGAGTSTGSSTFGSSSTSASGGPNRPDAMMSSIGSKNAAFASKGEGRVAQRLLQDHLPDGGKQNDTTRADRMKKGGGGKANSCTSSSGSCTTSCASHRDYKSGPLAGYNKNNLAQAQGQNKSAEDAANEKLKERLLHEAEKMKRNGATEEQIHASLTRIASVAHKLKRTSSTTSSNHSTRSQQGTPYSKGQQHSAHQAQYLQGETNTATNTNYNVGGNAYAPNARTTSSSTSTATAINSSSKAAGINGGGKAGGGGKQHQSYNKNYLNQQHHHQMSAGQYNTGQQGQGGGSSAAYHGRHGGGGYQQHYNSTTHSSSGMMSSMSSHNNNASSSTSGSRCTSGGQQPVNYDAFGKKGLSSKSSALEPMIVSHQNSKKSGSTTSGAAPSNPNSKKGASTLVSSRTMSSSTEGLLPHHGNHSHHQDSNLGAGTTTPSGSEHDETGSAEGGGISSTGDHQEDSADRRAQQKKRAQELLSRPRRTLATTDYKSFSGAANAHLQHHGNNMNSGPQTGSATSSGNAGGGKQGSSAGGYNHLNLQKGHQHYAGSSYHGGAGGGVDQLHGYNINSNNSQLYHEEQMMNQHQHSAQQQQYNVDYINQHDHDVNHGDHDHWNPYPTTTTSTTSSDVLQQPVEHAQVHQHSSSPEDAHGASSATFASVTASGQEQKQRTSTVAAVEGQGQPQQTHSSAVVTEHKAASKIAAPVVAPPVMGNKGGKPQSKKGSARNAWGGASVQKGGPTYTDFLKGAIEQSS